MYETSMILRHTLTRTKLRKKPGPKKSDYQPLPKPETLITNAGTAMVLGMVRWHASCCALARGGGAGGNRAQGF